MGEAARVCRDGHAQPPSLVAFPRSPRAGTLGPLSASTAYGS